MSTVPGACWAAGGEETTSATGAPDLGSSGEGSGGGTKTYVVVASEDGAVRFYDLKFRVEVSVARYDKKGASQEWRSFFSPPRTQQDMNENYYP